MLAIKKAPEPEFFKSYVEDPSQKKALRDYILEKEQQHLCCYCETQISGNREDSILEHIRPRSKYPEWEYDYNNLLVSCSSKDRCGHFKKNNFSDFFIIQTEENPADYLTYSASGDIRPIDNSRKGRETIDILNLNQAKLKQARRTLFKQLIKMIRAGNLDDCLAYFKEYPAFVDYVKENYRG